MTAVDAKINISPEPNIITGVRQKWLIELQNLILRWQKYEKEWMDLMEIAKEHKWIEGTLLNVPTDTFGRRFNSAWLSTTRNRNATFERITVHTAQSVILLPFKTLQTFASPSPPLPHPPSLLSVPALSHTTTTTTIPTLSESPLLSNPQKLLPSTKEVSDEHETGHANSHDDDDDDDDNKETVPPIAVKTLSTLHAHEDMKAITELTISTSTAISVAKPLHASIFDNFADMDTYLRANDVPLRSIARPFVIGEGYTTQEGEFTPTSHHCLEEFRCQEIRQAMDKDVEEEEEEDERANEQKQEENKEEEEEEEDDVQGEKVRKMAKIIGVTNDMLISPAVTLTCATSIHEATRDPALPSLKTPTPHIPLFCLHQLVCETVPQVEERYQRDMKLFGYPDGPSGHLLNLRNLIKCGISGE